MLMISLISVASCATSNPPVAIKGSDFDDLKNGCPAVTGDKMWMTYDYAKRYFHWENHK
jgi:hypothetical protein